MLQRSALPNAVTHLGTKSKNQEPGNTQRGYLKDCLKTFRWLLLITLKLLTPYQLDATRLAPPPPRYQLTPCSGRARLPPPPGPPSPAAGGAAAPGRPQRGGDGHGAPGPAPPAPGLRHGARPGPAAPASLPGHGPGRMRAASASPEPGSPSRPRPLLRLGLRPPGLSGDQRWRQHGRGEQGARTLHGCVRSPSELPRCWQ